MVKLGGRKETTPASSPLTSNLHIHALSINKQTNKYMNEGTCIVEFYADVKKNEIMVFRKINTNGNRHIK